MFCEECGCKLSEGVLFCPECGMKVEQTGGGRKEQVKRVSVNASGQQQRKEKAAVTPSAAVYTKGQTQHSARAAAVNTTQMNEARKNLGDIVLSDGEVIVKQYLCAATKFAVGYLTVTNKRVIYSAVGGNSRVSEEITLSSVSGISSYYGKNIDSRQIYSGIMLILVSLVLMTVLSSFLYVFSMLFFVGICIGAYMIFRAIRSAFQLVIYAKDVNVSPVVVGEGPRSIVGNTAVFAVYSDRTRETDIMLNEVGALIQDLQTMGDLAIEKWQKRIDISNLPAL